MSASLRSAQTDGRNFAYRGQELPIWASKRPLLGHSLRSGLSLRALIIAFASCLRVFAAFGHVLPSVSPYFLCFQRG